MTLIRGWQRIFLGLALLAVAVAALTNGRVESASTAPVTVYALTAANPPHLITFSSATPGVITSDVIITGLLTQNIGGTDHTETIVGIDFRPSTGVLYAIGFVGSSQHVYTINMTTGVVTPVSMTSFAASLAGSNFGMTFNPATDLIRLIGPFGLNLRLSPTTGQVVATDAPTINGIAGLAQLRGNPYFIDTQTDSLGQMANPNAGTVMPIGTLGVTAADRVGFDFAPDGTALASIKLSIIASDPVGFFRIDLVSGAATLVGNIGGGHQVTGIAIAPAIGPSTIGIFRSGAWYLNNQLDGSGAEFSFSYGAATDVPIAGDWDCSGTATPGVFRNGAWYLSNAKNGTGPHLSFFFGAAGDVPIVGDWNGDGCDSVGVFRSGWFFMTDAVTGSPIPHYSFFYGAAGDVPVTGDSEGNGADSVGIFRSGSWFLTNAITGSPIPHYSFAFGAATDVPVTGDWGAIGPTRVGIFRNGAWFLTNAITGSPAPSFSFAFGGIGDRPVTGAWGTSSASAVPSAAVAVQPCALSFSCTPGPNDWTGPVGGLQPPPPGAWTGPATPPPPGWTGIGAPLPVGPNPLAPSPVGTQPQVPASTQPVQQPQPFLPALPHFVPPPVVPVLPPMALVTPWRNPAPVRPQQAPSPPATTSNVPPASNTAPSTSGTTTHPVAPVEMPRLRPPSTGDAGLLAIGGEACNRALATS
jgi:hypothetical protein